MEGNDKCQHPLLDSPGTFNSQGAYLLVALRLVYRTSQYRVSDLERFGGQLFTASDAEPVNTQRRDSSGVVTSCSYIYQ